MESEKELSSEGLESLREKLSDFSFYTVHNLRHPLTNLISLLDMLKEVDKDEKRRVEIQDLIKIEALKLEEVVRVMLVKLETE